MRNDKTIAKALGRAVEYYGSNAALAAQVSLHAATIGQYRNGRIQHITDDAWEALYPYLRPYLPEYLRDAYRPPRVASQQIFRESGTAYQGNESDSIARLRAAWPHLTLEQRNRIDRYINAILEAEGIEAPC